MGATRSRQCNPLPLSDAGSKLEGTRGYQAYMIGPAEAPPRRGMNGREMPITGAGQKLNECPPQLLSPIKILPLGEHWIICG